MRQKQPEKKSATDKKLNDRHFLWKKMSFAGTEAYNLLRTNLVLSFSGDEKGARIIGVTSVEHAEGKTLNSINIAAALAKANYKTLLLECDLRLPVVAEYLNINSDAGLSDFLTGLSPFQEIIHTGVAYDSLDVITCGQIPPNPSELLGSGRMAAALKAVKERYDYIVLDFPPVGTVADPMVLFHHTDGFVLVVRNDHTSKPELQNVVRQIRYAGTRILGFVYNDSENRERGYGKRYSKKYYHYSYGYGNQPKEK